MVYVKICDIIFLRNRFPRGLCVGRRGTRATFQRQRRGGVNQAGLARWQCDEHRLPPSLSSSISLYGQRRTNRRRVTDGAHPLHIHEAKRLSKSYVNPPTLQRHLCSSTLWLCVGGGISPVGTRASCSRRVQPRTDFLTDSSRNAEACVRCRASESTCSHWDSMTVMFMVLTAFVLTRGLVYNGDINPSWWVTRLR